MKNKLEPLEIKNFTPLTTENSKKVIGGVDEGGGTAAGCVDTNLGAMHYTSDSGGTPNTFYGTSYTGPCA